MQNTRRGVHGQTVEILAHRIVSGEIPEGATLDLGALRRELDVSLTALREALKVLTAKGIVDARQKRGTFVRPRMDWNLLDGDVIQWQVAGGADAHLMRQLAEVREIIEPAAARLAARRATDDDLAALDHALDDMGAATGAVGATRADLGFHRTLLAATHNELLRRMEVVMAALAERDRYVHGGRADDPVPSHRAVVEAIRAHDAAGAEARMRELLDRAARDVERRRPPRSRM
jgi:GntR family transcriptional regulator, galactonate operon transcriptional repressor